MYAVSPFTPIFFNPTTDRFGARSKYMQIFAPTDQVLIEVIAVSEYKVITGTLINLVNNKEQEITWDVWAMNATTKLYYYVITGLASGYYCFDINGMISEPFKITNDSDELAGTTLIQYSMKDNKQRTDGVFWVGDKQFFFDFRAPGGFKDSDWTFGVNNEQFVTSDEDIVDLFSMETTQKAFTLGNAMGCPIWYADLLNRIMSCSYVYFDGERFSRKESSVPELTQEIEGLKSYIFKITLQEIKHVDKLESDNILKIRRVEGDVYRKVANKVLVL